MFWWEREETGSRERNGGPPCGQVRVLVVGDAVSWRDYPFTGVELFHDRLLKKTLRCWKDIPSTPNLEGFFHCSTFSNSWLHSGCEGVIFVHDLSQRRTKTNLHKWAAEIAANGTFSAPLGSGGPGGLPVPYLVIGNKTDISAKEGTRVSSGNLVDVARQWVEKQGLLPSSEELPLAESFPGSSGLLAAAKEARYDKEAVIKFFRMLIRRRYFSDELPGPSPWSISPLQNLLHLTSENSSDENQLHRRLSLSGEGYKSSVLPPLPAQLNLAPPPTLYPQQPMSVPESYSFHRFSTSGLSEMGSTKSSRADINV
ncbi:GTP-binding protein [Musa troglodytarum]|uniref:GTP-binding protein n=1 Tax=Musa troglodytarum TaxID=320322 RepID=A0A9E7F6W7_9LILI|nr:GTP-binding protein [Musa troglodytarum]